MTRYAEGTVGETIAGELELSYAKVGYRPTIALTTGGPQ